MASPFAVFRKHQKVLMAVACLMAIFAFVFADTFLSMQGGTNVNPAVVETDFGTLRESDMLEMLNRGRIVREFLQTAILSQPVSTFEEQRMLYFQAQQTLQQFGQVNETNVVQTRVLAEQAEEIGMRVNDETITQFLAEVTNNRVPAAQFTAILNSISQGQQITRKMIYDMLREELMANRMRLMCLLTFQSTPAERWDYFRKMRLRATAELVPVRVSDFIDQVPDPSDKVLTAFFEEYKEVLPVPGSPTPGFKVPTKAAFQYFKADYAHFNDPAAVTDEDVLAYYEKYKAERYVYNPASDSSLFDESATEETPDDTADDTSATPPAGNTPSDNEGADSDAPDSKESPAESTEDTPADNDQSATGRSATELQAELLREQRETGDEDAAEETGSTESTDATQPDTTATAEADDDTTPEPPPPLGDDLMLPENIVEGPHPQYEPLWKVEDEIRNTLAGERAVARIKEIFTGLRNKMRDHAFGQEDPAKPGMQFEPLAAEHEGISAHKTPLLSAYEASQLEGLGQANVGGQTFLAFAYGTYKPYSTADAEDSDGNQYLFWKIEEHEEHVPKLEEVRAEVVRAWKTIEARDLARARADELANLATGSDKSLETTFADDKDAKVLKTNPFTWLTTGTSGMFGPQVPELSQVEGVEDAGNDFMSKVFELGVGQVGVATNEPLTVMYVVRVTSLEPNTTVLREIFLADRFSTYAGAAMMDRQRFYENWLEAQTEAAGVVWLRPANDSRGS